MFGKPAVARHCRHYAPFDLKELGIWRDGPGSRAREKEGRDEGKQRKFGRIGLSGSRMEYLEVYINL